MADSSSSPSMHPYNHNFTDEDLNDILGASLMEDPSHSGETTIENPGSSGAADHECRSKEDDDDDDLDGISSDAKTQARTERKRSREKQRRSDVNRQFADLSQLLRRIESEEEGRTSLPLSSAGPTNRVDLIARTINIMERTHELSKKRKTEIASLQKQLEDSQKMAEDTAARLKEATLYQHHGQQKQVCVGHSFAHFAKCLYLHGKFYFFSCAQRCMLSSYLALGHDDGPHDGQSRFHGWRPTWCNGRFLPSCHDASNDGPSLHDATDACPHGGSPYDDATNDVHATGTTSSSRCATSSPSASAASPTASSATAGTLATDSAADRGTAKDGTTAECIWRELGPLCIKRGISGKCCSYVLMKPLQLEKKI